MKKYPIDPARLRHLPPRFSWLDQRLVGAGHLSRCSRDAQALYLFLAVVSDANGLSYYSDRNVCGHLGMSPEHLAQARSRLRSLELVAYRKPLYQVLDLDPHKAGHPPRENKPLSIAELLRPRP